MQVARNRNTHVRPYGSDGDKTLSHHGATSGLDGWMDHPLDGIRVG